MSKPNELGFVLPPAGPPQQQQPYYPPPSYPSGQHQHQQQQQQQQQQQPYYPPQPQHSQHYQQQPFPPPIQHQPPQSGYAGGTGGWFPSANFQNYLRSATSFHVKQKVEFLEALVGWETPNQYTVKDQSGNKIFYVGEESGCCPRQLCAGRRPFTLAVKDSAGQSVLVFDRELDCSCCCGMFCPDSLTVSTPTGQKLGSVKEEFDLLYPKLSIRDAADNQVLRLEGPLCPMALGCGPVVFRVTNMNGVSVGTISKEWSGLVRELFTDADYFSMSFPIDLDPSIKAVCLAALFLIDFEYFESGHDKHQGGRRLFG